MDLVVNEANAHIFVLLNSLKSRGAVSEMDVQGAFEGQDSSIEHPR